MAKRLGTRRALIVGLVALGLIAAFVGVASGNHIFSDVPSGAYYHDEVSWLYNRGVVSGCGSGKYCPNDPFTRGQAAVMLNKFATTTRTGHFSCDAYGFQPSSSTQTFNIGIVGAYSDGALSCPVHIPDGSTITQLWVQFFDNHASDANCTLYRYDLISSGGYTSMALVTTTGTPQLTTSYDNTITNATVNNGAYSYIVYCTFGANSSSLNVRAASITYTYPGIPAP